MRQRLRHRLAILAVAEIEQARGMAAIARVEGRRTATVIGDVDTARANTNEVLEAVEKTFGDVLTKRFPGVEMDFQGQAGAQAETGASVRRSFLVGLVAMFIVLSFRFRSHVEPLIVMLAIPLALTGVVGGHWLMGLDLSTPSMVGFVSLAGIVVNNSIQLVVFIKMHVANGSPIAEAARNASLDRFRAIFMTSATTVAGLAPLLFETGVQAQVLIPLVTSLAFGLVAATALVILLVPALYVMLDDVKRRIAASTMASTTSHAASR
jgi:hydrophobic/amphiphilic exporter-1 (mainly G- bacteria), HAE1 family